MLKYIFKGVGLTSNARVLVQHVTPWDHEFAAAVMGQNAARAVDMPTIMYTASGWAQNHPTMCKTLLARMSDELYNFIGQGTYTITGLNTYAAEPTDSEKRPDLDKSMFKRCKPQYSSRQLPVMDSKLTHAQAFSALMLA